MRWRTVAAANVGTVVELVAQLSSVAKADEFIDKQTNAWEGCADEVITAKEKVRTSTTQYRVTAVRARPHIVTASTRVVSSEMRCQHVLQAMSNVILEVSACRTTFLIKLRRSRRSSQTESNPVSRHHRGGKRCRGARGPIARPHRQWRPEQ